MCSIGPGDLLQQRGHAGWHGSVHAISEAPSGDEFELEVEPATGLADVVQLDDVGVLNSREGLRLAEPSLTIAGRADGPAREKLEGDSAFQVGLPGPVNDAHSTTSEFAFDKAVGECGQIVCAGRRRWSPVRASPSPRGPIASIAA